MEQGIELLYIGAAAVLFAFFVWSYHTVNAKLLNNQVQLEERLEEDRVMLWAEGGKDWNRHLAELQQF